MKLEVVSEMILNALKHEFQNASETRLLELARQLQEARLAGPRRGSPGNPPPVSKQKLSKTVLRSLRPAGPGSRGGSALPKFRGSGNSGEATAA